MTFPSRLIPFGVVAVAAAVAGTAHAESPEAARIKDLEKKLERSLDLIDKLSAKVEQLEQSTASTKSAQANAAQQAEKIQQLERNISEVSVAASRRSADDGLPVHGFADVGIMSSRESNPTFKGRKGTALGTFDLYLTPQFGDRVKSLVELAFEADQDGGIATDLERLQVGYTFSDSATGWVGRFHTPYGYWNTAFHHGAQIQTAVLRPKFLDFEDKGGILPAHSTGLWLNGATRIDSSRVGYDLYVANSPQINGASPGSALAASNPGGFSPTVNAGGYAGSAALNMRQSGSTSYSSSIGFNLWIEPPSVDGLRIGLHGLRSDVKDDSADGNRTALRMYGGYFAYTADPWEILGEYYRFRNRDKSGTTGSHNSWAGYAQIGYNVGKFTPYARVERASLDQHDNYFAVQESGRSYRRAAVGLRYDLDPKAALKMELNGTRLEDLGPDMTDRYPELRLQYSIRF